MIYFIQYTAEPRGRAELKGAFINCWVNAVDENSAKRSASKAIKDNEWDIGKTLHIHPSDESLYEPDSEGLTFHRQALVEDCVIVFYAWLQSAAKKKGNRRLNKRIYTTVRQK